ncbi:MAG: hypothetical protein AB7O57_10535 [Hyphomicrobiaceae bacterium]
MAGEAALPRSAGVLLPSALAVSSLASALAMVAGARSGVTWIVTAAAAAFTVAAVIVAIAAERDVGRANATRPDASRDRLHAGAVTAAIAYAWGAVAMQGLYITPLTGLKWQHGWQYAAAMLLLACISIVIARRLRSSSPGLEATASLLAAGQAAVAGGGLIALVATGKLWSVRADWAANRVFAALAIAVLAISLSVLVAHIRPARASPTP